MSAAGGIDIHYHFVTPSYFAAAAEEMDEEPRWANTFMTSHVAGSRARTFTGRAAEMVAAGIGMALLSVPPIIFRDGARSVRAARGSNDELVDAAATDAHHFRVLASLPLPFVDASLEELERVKDAVLVAGLIVPCGSASWTLDEDRFLPLLRLAADARLPILIHPGLEEPPPLFDKWQLRAGVGVTIDTTIAALRLILSGALDKCPSLSIIVPHLGGVIPYLETRLVERCGRGDAAESLEHYLRQRVFYDTCSSHPPALTCAIETVGAERIMLGSDYPFAADLPHSVEPVLKAPVDVERRDKMLFGTASSVMRVVSLQTNS
jgi:aminocarboxymuconate-semialdehyde decarboxylase